MQFPFSPKLAAKTRSALLPEFIINRPRLIDILSDREGGQITLITGPPGYGKSTLVNQWLINRGAEAGWLCLDEEDNDPIIFWEYLFHITNCDSTLLSETANNVSPPEMAAVLLGLMESRSKSSTLVIDDYHHISNQVIHDSFRYFLFHLPPQHRIIILSRTEPPLGLGRLRMTDRLKEIRTDDLAFNEEETTSLLSHNMTPDLGTRFGRELTEKTEGWITAISLTVLAMKCSDQRDVIGKLGGTDRYIADFLIEEVLYSLSEEEYDLLLEMSVPDRFSGSMLMEITGRNNAATLAESFWKRNFFIISDSQELDEMRFHPFFRQFLLHRLNNDKPDRNSEINRAITKYYLGINNEEEALEYAFRCKDEQIINELLEPVGARLWSSRRLNRFEKWIVGNAGLDLVKYPSILLYLIRIHLHKGEVDEAFGKLKKLEETLSSGSVSNENHLRISVMLIKATLALYMNELNLLHQFSRNAIDLIGDDINRMKGMALTFYGVSGFYSGAKSVMETIGIFHEAFGESIRANDWIMALSASFHKALFQRFAGNLNAASDELETIEEKIHSLQMPLNGIYGNAMSEKAIYACEQGEYDKAVTLADNGLELTNESCTNSSIWWSLNIRALILHHTGQFAESMLCLKKLEKRNRVSAVPIWFHNLYLALKLRTMISLNDFSGAKYLIHENGLSNEKTPDRINTSLYLAYARYLVAVKRNDEAESILTAINRETEGSGLHSFRIESGLLLAPLLEKKKSGRGCEMLSDIIDYCYMNGYFASICREGQQLLPILNSLKFQQNNKINYVRKIIKRIASDSKTEEKNSMDFELTEREKEVLILMGKGYSNREISELLFISMNTTKTHLKNINNKLGSENRTQAVFIGREAGIC